MNSAVTELERRSAPHSITPTAHPGLLEPDAHHWISEFAYYLWLAEGGPAGQDQWHWYQAEAAYIQQRVRRTHEAQGAHEVRRFQQLVASIPSRQDPSPEEVAFAALRAWYDVEEAFQRVCQLRELLCRIVGEHVVDDGYQILKAWKHHLNGQEKTARIAAALRRIAEVAGNAHDPDQGQDIGVDIVDTEVLEEAARTFRAELPELLKTHPRQWVAYCGKERIGFGPSKAQLTQECIRRGFAYENLLVRMVQPDIPATRMSR